MLLRQKLEDYKQQQPDKATFQSMQGKATEKAC